MCCELYYVGVCVLDVFKYGYYWWGGLCVEEDVLVGDEFNSRCCV